MSIILTVEICAGTSESEAAADLVTLANRVGVAIQAVHNGVGMRARPGDSFVAVLEEFEREKRWVRGT